jgi:hypothetical protein
VWDSSGQIKSADYFCQVMADAVKQVAAEDSLVCFFAQFAVGGADQREIDIDNLFNK